MLYHIHSRMCQTLFLLVIVCYLVITLVSFSTGVKTDELRKQILSHYNKSVSPWFGNSPSDVGTLLSLTRIQQFDDSKSTLTVEAYLFINWYDLRLRWEDDDTYNNISGITAKSDDIWKPNMNVFNNGRSQEYRNTEMPLFVVKNGKVWWTVVGDLYFVCVQEDLKWYPLDTHICKLSLGSLYPQDIYSRMLLYQNKTIHGANYEAIIENPHWKLLNLEHSEGVSIVGVVMTYATDDFTFEVRRQGWTLLAAFLPLMMSFMFLSWTSFALPPHGDLLSKRLSVSTTSLFLSSVFLLVLIKTVPAVGSRPPILVKVFVSVVFLEFFTCLHNVIMANILHNSSSHLGVLQKLPKQLLYILGLHVKSETPVRRIGLLENEETPEDVAPEQFQMEPVPDDRSNLVGTAYDRVHIFLQVTTVILVVAFLCPA